MISAETRQNTVFACKCGFQRTYSKGFGAAGKKR